jgi:hypothetical protein
MARASVPSRYTSSTRGCMQRLRQTAGHRRARRSRRSPLIRYRYSVPARREPSVVSNKYMALLQGSSMMNHVKDGPTFDADRPRAGTA